MDNEAILVTERDEIRNVIAEVVRREVVKNAPEALREVLKSKWLHRNEVKDKYGMTDRQLQYLRDNNEITYSQHGRRIWYLRKSVEEYFEEGRVNADG
ncbi:hypothetical protein [Salinibacter ruber]|uniref:hypothetical protein n=1 Tax=Salinibacter ruber TaxID=146919 RepID=UPI002168F5C8|nr:hypothetical protein [Salinibacter ruber]MCS4174574.1 5-bromo-4-chloroindolyl phosphate hydrolysis protein [Salinibacter ruber]